MAKEIVWSQLLRVLQNYVRNLVNFDISVVGHLDNFDKMQSYLDQGDNVVCLANHQTEADPGTDHRMALSHLRQEPCPTFVAFPGACCICSSHSLILRDPEKGL